MQRNDKTKAGSLKVGDRFYKVGDKKRKAFQMVEGTAKTTQYMTYKLFCLPVEIADNKLITDRIKQNQTSAILSNTEVVFLRSISNN